MILRRIMAQLKAHEADTWLAKPRPDFPVVLIYGPDRGLVSERASRFAQATGIAVDDAFSTARMDGAELDREPGRLLEEAQTIPMFGGRRLIWVRNAGASKQLGEAIRLLCKEPPPETIVLIEAGDLKKGAPLRSAVEQAATGMAIPCYADDARGIDGLIDTVMAEMKIGIDPDARALLRRSLGGDRLASRREVEKLALYALGRETVTAEDVRALSGDVSGRSTDDVIDAALSGNLEEFDRAFTRLASTGQAASVVSAMQRQLETLHALRARMDQEGISAGGAVASARPPVFFARRRMVEAALSRWERQTIGRMLESLQSVTLAMRRNSALSIGLGHRALMQIARSAAARNRQ